MESMEMKEIESALDGILFASGEPASQWIWIALR